MPRTAWGALALGVSLTGCISGPILRGYPEYPFETFMVAASADTVFFDLQPAIVAQGFPLDYTRLQQHLIATRPSEVGGQRLFLNIVVGPVGTGDSSKVWVAGYHETPAGPLRISPDDTTLWTRLVQVTAGLSTAVHGSEASGPEAPAGSPQDDQ